MQPFNLLSPVLWYNLHLAAATTWLSKWNILEPSLFADNGQLQPDSVPGIFYNHHLYRSLPDKLIYMHNNKLQYSQSHTTKIDTRMSKMVKCITENLSLIQIPAATGDKNYW
jgi:hypothetical protein